MGTKVKFSHNKYVYMSKSHETLPDTFHSLTASVGRLAINFNSSTNFRFDAVLHTMDVLKLDYMSLGQGFISIPVLSAMRNKFL